MGKYGNASLRPVMVLHASDELIKFSTCQKGDKTVTDGAPRNTLSTLAAPPQCGHPVTTTARKMRGAGVAAQFPPPRHGGGKPGDGTRRWRKGQPCRSRVNCRARRSAAARTAGPHTAAWKQARHCPHSSRREDQGTRPRDSEPRGPETGGRRS